MADVYIIYSGKDSQFTESLAVELARHWSVWWDYELVGDFQKVIESELGRAKCVVALWSTSSRESVPVRDEVRLAAEYGLEIIGIRLDAAQPAYPFGQYSSVGMNSDIPCAQQSGFRQLKAKIGSIVPPTRPPVRTHVLGDFSLRLPAVFLSVSSHETQLGPADAIKALRLFNPKSILVSAYDFKAGCRNQEVLDELTAYRSQGGFVLLDSGNYEKSRLDDDDWTVEAFHEVLGHVPHDAAFCYDVMVSSRDVIAATEAIRLAVERDSKHTNAPVFPIVHGSVDEEGKYRAESLAAIVKETAKAMSPGLIAVPERELGDGLLARVRRMLALRESLCELDFYQPIHLLGTGNPWSIAPLAAAGADSFDGLEWCRMVVDRQEHRLNHFHHFDFFAYQAAVAESEITVAALHDPELDYGGKVAFHNLDYYVEFTRDLQAAAEKGSLLAFLADVLPKPITKQIRREIKELST